MTKKIMANSALVVILIAQLITGILIGEYEFAKLKTPDSLWFDSPKNLDFFVSGWLFASTIIGLAVMYFVVSRKVDFHRRWLWRLVSANILIIFALWWVIGNNFTQIIWPH